MASASMAALAPRKLPRQGRSEATVEAILEATIQVLLVYGLDRVTTTRVAERAGVSVGTVYQYFPEKRALFYAILLRHFEAMALTMERAARDLAGRSLAHVAERIAAAYVEAKLARPDATRALYQVAGSIGQDKLSADAHRRLESAICALLIKAEDAVLDDPRRSAFVLMSALTGLTRTTFHRGDLTPEASALLRSEAALLARGYLDAAARSSLGGVQHTIGRMMDSLPPSLQRVR